ncbi:hypothetical protein [Shewanella sp. NIFS-20-20]|uniref:hypothetical protein n=1 Tax=Shewanella sp. NIFS-20-20 TaxID=2853806 RepID=UPI001C44C7A8|nr:hypothetical protein [Shewanella sp. NIFS-20-20]MBV7316573.1 hypothetical protein [Shewanella sp. NIFS-20-20]
MRQAINHSSRLSCVAITSLLLALPLPAMAFDLGGARTSMLVILGLGSLCLLNLCLQALFYFSGAYSRPKFAIGHVLIALLAPVIAIIMTLSDTQGFNGLSLNLGMTFIAIALALIPLSLRHNAKATGPHSSYILSFGALLFMLLALMIAPIGVFAMIAASVSIWFATQHWARLIALAILIPATTIFSIWLWQISHLILANVGG